MDNRFRIVTEWTAEAPIARIARILTRPERFPLWWPEVYLGVEVLDRGDENGVGGRVRVHSKGWLPYHLHWTGTVTEAEMPHRWVVAATGDLNGRGEWRLTQDGPTARIRYDWSVTADRPLFRILSPVLAPVFAWNHRWAMARGEAGLRRELQSGSPAARSAAT